MGNKTIAKIVEHAEVCVRERIIKLLEADLAKCDWAEKAKDLGYDPHCEPCDQTKHLIALIKGESQKDNETVVFLTEGEQK